MGTTTPHSLPYPEPTDPIAGGADAIKALAEALELKLPRMITTEFQSTPYTGNFTLDMTSFVPIPRAAGFMAITIAPKMYCVTGNTSFDLRFTATAAGNVVSTGPYGVNYATQPIGIGAWIPISSQTIWTPTVAGVRPNFGVGVFASSQTNSWHIAARLNTVEYVT